MAALFGLFGVIVGGLITVMTSYALDRRRGWLAARASGLQLLAELQRVDKGLVDPAQESSTLLLEAISVWEAHKGNLLFRPGNAPSGLTSDQWLDLARIFSELSLLQKRLSADVATSGTPGAQLIEKATSALGVFVPDRSAFRVVADNIMSRRKRKAE